MPRDNKPPACMFYFDDFASDSKVEAMSTLGVGAYVLLLCKAWRESPPCTIPSDDRLLARWSRMTDADWSEVRSEVLDAFVPCDDGRYVQKRLRKEYDKQRQRKKLRSEAGSRGAASRWQSHGNANGNAMAKEKGKETSKEKKERYRPGEVAFPGSLDTDPFREAWANWIAYKRDIGKPYKTERGEKSQLSRIAKWGHDRAIAAIEYSIGQEFQGIYEERGGGQSQGKSQAYDAAQQYLDSEGIA